MTKGKSGSEGPQTLRQVVAERCEHHVVDPVRGQGCYSGFVRAIPRTAGQVGILRSKLQPSLRPVVETNPDPERAFQQVPGIRAAASEGAEREAVIEARHSLCIAARKVVMS